MGSVGRLGLWCPCQNLEAPWDRPFPRVLGSPAGPGWAALSVMCTESCPEGLCCHWPPSAPGANCPREGPTHLAHAESSELGTEPRLLRFQTQE